MTSEPIVSPPPERRGFVSDAKPQGLWVALRELWGARRLLAYLVLRDIKGRYRDTVLGNWWIIIRPLVELSPYFIVFGLFLNLRPGPVPYALFLIAGFAPWFFLRGAISVAPNMWGRSRSLIKKVYFPRLVVPASQLAMQLLDFAVVMAAVLLVTPLFGVTPRVEWALLPLYMLLAIAIGLGLMMLLSSICLVRPDIGFGVPAALRLLFYCSAIVYPLSAVPAQFRWLFDFNPVTTVVNAVRYCVFGGDMPSTTALVFSVACALVLLALGMWSHLRSERTLADAL